MLTDQNEISNLNRVYSIDATYEVSVHLAQRFHRRRFKCEKLTEDGCQVMAKAHMAFWPGELKITLFYWEWRYKNVPVKIFVISWLHILWIISNLKMHKRLPEACNLLYGFQSNFLILYKMFEYIMVCETC